MYSTTPRLIQHLRESHPFLIDFSRSPNPLHQREEAAQKSLLPPELWAEIFLYCLPELPGPDPSNGSTPIAIPWYYRDRYASSLTAPLLLCQICRSWRQIALNLPQLWSRLVAFVSLGNTYPSIDLARLWLKRSGNLPLSLSLYQQDNHNANRVGAGRMLGLFVHFTSRWKDVQLHISGPRLGLSFVSDARTAPLLRRFVLCTHAGVYEREEKYFFGIFEDVPRLSHLHVSRIPELDMLGQGGLFTVPWRQLESLSLDHVPSVVTCLCILRDCVSLRQAQMGIASLFGPADEEPFSHPVLTSLSISITKDHLAGFLARVTLPSLQHLAVRVRFSPLEDVDHGWPHHEFGAFLERSASSSSTGLTRVELVNSRLRVDEFMRSILASRYLQGLEHLEVVNNRHHPHHQAMWDLTQGSFVTDVVVDLLKCPRLRAASSAITPLHDQTGVSQGSPPAPIDPTITNPVSASTSSASTSPLATAISDTADTDSESDEAWDVDKVTCFLPRLAKLVVQGSHCLQTSDGVISDMVESRWDDRRTADVAQLKSVAVDIPSGNLMDLQRLRGLQARGLDLVLGFCE